MNNTYSNMEQRRVGHNPIASLLLFDVFEARFERRIMK